MNPLWLLGAVVALLLVVILLARRSRPDALGDFQRQIDALSPEARKPVVDQVHRFEEAEEQGCVDEDPGHEELKGEPDGP